MDEPDDRKADAARRRRDIWQLHIPLVVVLALCTVITVVEVRRAGEGVWRAWIYMFEWPLIALFAVWIWHRYRTKGSLFKGLQDQWRQRIEQLGAETEAAEHERQKHGEHKQAPESPDDPQLAAWREYVAGLETSDPKDTPRA